MKRLLLLLIFLIMLVQCVDAEQTLSVHTSNIRVKSVIGKQWLLDEHGDIISSPYDSIQPFLHNVSIVSNNGKFGLLSITGQEILPCVYDSIVQEEDCLVLKQQNECGVFYGLSDIHGDILISPIYHSMEYENGMAVVSISGSSGGSGIIDRMGNVIVPLTFERIAPFESGWAWVVEKGSLRYNFVNKEGEFLLDVSADACSGFYGSFAIVRYGDRRFVISYDKKIYCEVFGKRIEYMNIDGLFLVKNNNHEFIYNAFSNEYTLLNNHVSSRGYYNGLIAVQNDVGKWGFMNENLEMVIPCIYDMVQNFSDDRVWATIDQEFYFLDREGNCYFSGALTAASPFCEGLAAIKVNTKWGFIDGYGNVKCAPLFESDEIDLLFINGYCNLFRSNPYVAFYITKDFEVFCQYDLWDIFLNQGTQNGNTVCE